MAELTKCRGCHKAVRIVATERGKQMPVDPDPTGHSTGTERTGAGVLVIRESVVHVLRPDEAWSGPLYVSHFATCREARRSNRRVLRKAVDAARARVVDELEGGDDAA